MRRRLFNIATMLSLLLCVAVCVLWVRSVFRGDMIIISKYPRVTYIGSNRGALWLANGYQLFVPNRTWNFIHGRGDPSQELVWVPRYRSAISRAAGPFREVLIPYWLAWVIFAILPALWVIRGRRRGRRGFPIDVTAASANR